MPKLTRDEIAGKHRELLSHGNPRAAVRSGSRTCEFAFEVGDGWLPIIDALLTSLEQLVAAMPDDKCKYFSVLQIKEKFGDLRVYCEPSTAAVSAVVAEAARRANCTCEECGAFGVRRDFAGHISVRCRACAPAFARDRVRSILGDPRSREES